MRTLIELDSLVFTRTLDSSRLKCVTFGDFEEENVIACCGFTLQNLSLSLLLRVLPVDYSGLVHPKPDSLLFILANTKLF